MSASHRSIRTVAIIGAGNTGSGVAYRIINRGFSVVLIDETVDRARAGLSQIRAWAKNGVQKGLLDAALVEQSLARVTLGERLEEARDADLVVEAVLDDLALKRDLFARLDAICPPDAILATTTRSFRVGDIAAAITAPSRFLGISFLHPAATNRVVEVIRHSGTTDAIATAVWELQKTLGHEPIAVADYPGFAAARLFLAWLNEALRLIDDGFSVATVEQAASAVFGLVHGPFALMNASGGGAAALRMLRILAATDGSLYVPARTLRHDVEQPRRFELSGVADSAKQAVAADRLIGVSLYVAFDLVARGIATRPAVETCACQGFRWKQGPFAMAKALPTARIGSLLQSAESRLGLEPVGPVDVAANDAPDQTRSSCA